MGGDLRRRHRAAPWALAAVLLVGAGGCGGGPATAADYCTQLAKANETFNKRCVQEPAAQWAPWGKPYFKAWCEDVAVAVAARRVTYDPAAAQACLDSLNHGGCWTIDEPPAPCAQALAGKVATGKDCYEGMDCVPTDYCTGGCPGTCQPKVKAGGDCSQGQVCAAHAYCDGSVCQGYSPYILVAPDGGACKSDGDCPWYEACYGGTCGPIHGVGGTCSSGAECGAGLNCSAGTCVQAPGTGASCNPNKLVFCGGVDYCRAGQSSGAGVCAAPAGPGDACDPSQSGVCGTGWWYCSQQTRTCVEACRERVTLPKG